MYALLVPKWAKGAFSFALASSGCDTLLSYVPTFGSSKLLNAYPSPATTAFWIENVDIGRKVSLYNVLGEEVKMLVAENNTFDILTSAIPNGIYLLQFQYAQPIWKQKWIIQSSVRDKVLINGQFSAPIYPANVFFLWECNYLEKRVKIIGHRSN